MSFVRVVGDMGTVQSGRALSRFACKERHVIDLRTLFSIVNQARYRHALLEDLVPDNPKLEGVVVDDAVLDDAVLNDAIAGDRVGHEAILDDGVLGDSLCAGDYGISVVIVPSQMLWES